ncbi:hypothetical protein BX616_005574 [Lobosporangium transversale]|uniref:Uncharacterized protein n=1 Tax=Lobosporangium transversale TaxID=64571 RepID=A0A1Y2H1D8_9FUNG|nr:hypothetical protein BCR41DRAFT_383183 [Lobosporangium transversale]KAF9897448.1 hypothetical protein BX616_005574 [Lobosporangium transversale]ORZ28346.1 hypothetical protein BCR41DRAFT_383183 [Lobosporangium transversale]|eukprot:XP_021886031.1 hypothetical protein BCR41DRAFT_383183 [Lobosporangium transversale]
MPGQAAIYISALVALLGLFGTFGYFFIYRKIRKEMKVWHEYEHEAHQRRQEAIEKNLPPIYIDHQHDPRCVYEDEIPSQYEDTQGEEGSQAIPRRAVSPTGSVIVVVPNPTIDELEIAMPQQPPPSYHADTHRQSHYWAYQSPEQTPTSIATIATAGVISSSETPHYSVGSPSSLTNTTST